MPIEGITLNFKNGNINNLKSTLVGPKNSPYEGGIFVLDLIIPQDYPFSPPKITMITNIYHPNIASSGKIQLDVLNNSWSPEMTIPKAILFVQDLLLKPIVKDAVNRDIAKNYIEDK